MKMQVDLNIILPVQIGDKCTTHCVKRYAKTRYASNKKPYEYILVRMYENIPLYLLNNIKNVK